MLELVFSLNSSSSKVIGDVCHEIFAIIFCFLDGKDSSFWLIKRQKRGFMDGKIGLKCDVSAEDCEKREDLD